MNDEKKYFFDNPDNVKRVLQILVACCVLLFALDFVIHRHVMHSWENLWGFYPVYGFVGCVILVLVAKWMRTFLMRPEDYYDEGEVEINQKSDSSQIHSSDTGGNHVDN
jgi:protein-S-isoprenylcysteine O-methyltransferase Ste14